MRPMSRGVTWGVLLGTAFLLVACNGKGSSPGGEPPKVAETPAVQASPAKKYAQKVWIVGFDGVDPGWLMERVKAGELPNVKKLMDQGTFAPLTSTNPPQSPVAWASFATGVNPGGHGIFDFIKRDPKTYLPAVGTGEVTPATFSPEGQVLTSPVAVNARTGNSFWKLASDFGVQTMALNVPYAFPAEEMVHGAVLAGLGTPDVRGTNSTFTFFSTRLTPQELEKGVAGGKLVALAGSGPAFEARFDGPAGPSSRASTPVKFSVDKGQKKVTIEMPEAEGRTSEVVAEGQWSDWFDYRFQVTSSYVVRAIGRFHVVSLDPLEVFMYPPNIHPEHPWVPFTSPVDYSARLKQAYGFFKTVGWTHDTNALNSEKLSDKPWLDDVFYAMDSMANIGVKELSKQQADLFIWVETATDRIPHMMTRVTDRKSPRFEKGLEGTLGGDPIGQAYRRMDQILGKIMEMMTPDVTLMVMSDHGFHTYRRGLHTNAWLLENGYLTLLPGKSRGADTNLFTAVDWSKTKAYALGTGQVYVNLAGREGQGIVTQAEYEPLVKELVTKLQALKDSRTGEQPVSRVYRRDEIYKGVRFQDAPDLQVSYREGWRTSWETMLGGIPEGVFADNMKKWSGDHSASDVTDTPGIFITNRPMTVKDPAIVDLAPTVLSIFGVPKPAGMEGRDLFAGSLSRPPLPAGK